jgi:ribosomal protein S18 acetylase RimI-like enzyme
LNKSHIEPAAGILVRAFRDYPLLQDSFSDELQRKRVAPYFFRYSLFYGIRYGEAYATSPNLEGAAVWIPSENFPVTFWRAVRSVPLSVILGFGREGGGRMKYPGEYIDAMHKRLAPFKHWFLQTIGVDPQFQRKGYAGKLLRPMFARMDKEGLPCYLETLDEQNIQLYEHFGFKVVEKATIPKTSLTSWAMLREVQ